MLDLGSCPIWRKRPNMLTHYVSLNPGDFLLVPNIVLHTPTNERKKKQKYPSLNLHFNLLPFQTIHATISPSPLSHRVAFTDPPLLFTNLFILSIHPSFHQSISHHPNGCHHPVLTDVSFLSLYSTYINWQSVLPMRIWNSYKLYELAIPISHTDFQSMWHIQIVNSCSLYANLYWQHRLPIRIVQ